MSDDILRRLLFIIIYVPFAVLAFIITGELSEEM